MNHSLCATAATRLYHRNINEQLIMSVTNHKSIDGIRSYKRTSKDRFKVLSDVLHKPSDGTGGSKHSCDDKSDDKDSDELKAVVPVDNIDVRQSVMKSQLISSSLPLSPLISIEFWIFCCLAINFKSDSKILS